MNNFKEERKLLAGYLNQCIPRHYKEEWMVKTCGETLYGWDEGAMEEGYLRPTYEFFEAYDLRRIPLLTFCLLKAAKIDPEACKNSLAALELSMIDQVILSLIKNGKELADSKVDSGRYPVSVLLTVGYNLRHLAPLLVQEDEGIQPKQKRALMDKFYNALIKTGLQASVNHHLREQEVKMGNLEEVIRQHYLLSPEVVFLKLAAEVYLAAADKHASDSFKETIDNLAISNAIKADLLIKKQQMAGRDLALAYKDKTLNWPLVQPNEEAGISWEAWQETDLASALRRVEEKALSQFHSACNQLKNKEEQEALAYYHQAFAVMAA